MGLQPPLRRLGIVGRDHQQPVRTLGRTSLGQPDAVRGVIGAGTGDNTGPVPHRFQDGPQQLDFLPVGGGRRLAGGARDHQTVAPLIDQVVGQPRRGGGVQGAIAAKRCHHRGQQGS